MNFESFEYFRSYFKEFNHGVKKINLRVRAEGSTNNIERGFINKQPPEAMMITSSIQVPDMQTLGQCQPAAEIFAMLHLNEKYVGYLLLFDIDMTSSIYFVAGAF